MTSSALPQQPGSQQPDTQSDVRVKRRRRERSQPTLWAIAGVFFILGAAASTATIWQLNKLYQATIAPPVAVEGILKAQYDYDKTEKLNPPPSGYYIEGAGVGRVYLTGKPLQNFVGKKIEASGTVDGICGPKTVPCYPQLTLRNVQQKFSEN